MTEATAPAAPYVPDPAKPPAVICDLDGTLARRQTSLDAREWTDVSRVGEDTVDPMVRAALEGLHVYAGLAVVLVSGRPEDCRRQTETWLLLNGLGYGALYMRPSGDFRPDYVVKAELFDRLIRRRWGVRLAIDDRDQMVELWRRQLGIPCWQVADGNF